MRVVLVVALLVAGCGERRGVPLWTVSGPGGARGLVLGTYHRGVPAERLPDVVWDELLASDRLILEADITGVTTSELDAAIALPGPSLQVSLGRDDWLLLVERVGGLISPGLLDETQPWFIESTYVNTFFPPGPGMDLELQERAAAAGIEVGVLEAWEYQAEILNALPLQESLDSLLETVRDRALTARLLQEGIAAYEGNDVPVLTRQWHDPEAAARRPAWYENVLLRRNGEWLPALSAAFAGDGSFVAVGVAHLLGDPSVLTLLQDEGFTIEPFFGGP